MKLFDAKLLQSEKKKIFMQKQYNVWFTWMRIEETIWTGNKVSNRVHSLHYPITLLPEQGIYTILLCNCLLNFLKRDVVVIFWCIEDSSVYTHVLYRQWLYMQNCTSKDEDPVILFTRTGQRLLKSVCHIRNHTIPWYTHVVYLKEHVWMQ